MQERLGHILFDEGLVKKTDRILCAVSGGADSMVMTYLLAQLGQAITVAHCNFQLRGDESDQDEVFVRQYCNQNNIPFVSNKFDTITHSRQNKISIQEAARNLRYQWFESERSRLECDWIFTAHNLSDHAETILINQLRGTGIKGLLGIPVKRGYVIRPLLQFRSNAIRAFAAQNNIPFRNDSSNETDAYVRNTIRHHVTPALSKISANFEQTFSDNAKKIDESVALIESFVARFKLEHVTHENEEMQIPKIAIHSFPQSHLILSKLVSDAKFDIKQIKQILLSDEVGKRIESQTHTLLSDRENFILTPKIIASNESITIDKIGNYSFGNFLISVTETTVQETTFPLAKNEIVVKQPALSDTILVRSWQQKDTIKPFGMRGTKLVSDVLIDNKVSSLKKSQLPIFEVNSQVLWVGGLCFSEIFKIDKKLALPSDKIIRISLNSKEG